MPAIGRASSSPGPPTIHRPARGKVRADDGGTAAVELAIVLPLLLLLIFGMIDFGRVMQQQIVMTEAVREGARVGALGGDATAVKAQMTSVLGSGFVIVQPPAIAVCTSASGLTSDSTVTIAHKFDAITPFWGIMKLFGTSNSTFTLSATGIMSCVG